MGVFAAAGASKFTSEAKQSSWSLLKTWKLLASDDVEDHSHASFRIKVSLWKLSIIHVLLCSAHCAVRNAQW